MWVHLGVIWGSIWGSREGDSEEVSILQGGRLGICQNRGRFFSGLREITTRSKVTEGVPRMPRKTTSSSSDPSDLALNPQIDPIWYLGSCTRRVRLVRGGAARAGSDGSGPRAGSDGSGLEIVIFVGIQGTPSVTLLRVVIFAGLRKNRPRF